MSFCTSYYNWDSSSIKSGRGDYSTTECKSGYIELENAKNEIWEKTRRGNEEENEGKINHWKIEWRRQVGGGKGDMLSK